MRISGENCNDDPHGDISEIKSWISLLLYKLSIQTLDVFVYTKHFWRSKVR